MSGPKISVAIPVFNRTQLLREAVESVLVQKAENVEILIVDNASVQDVYGAVSSYVERGLVKFIRNERNIGMVANWNRCLQLATGDIINVLHSDDRLEEDAIQRAQACFEQYRDLGLVYSDDCPRTIYMPAGPAAARRLCDGGHNASSVFIARRCIKSCGVYHEDLKYSADEEYYPRIAAQFGIICVKPPLAHVRNHAGRGMMETWREKDLVDQFRRVRMAARQHAGQSGMDLESAVLKDLARGSRFAAAYALQWGDKTLFRHCYRVGAYITRAEFAWREHLYYYSSFVPGGYELLRHVGALKRMARRGFLPTHLRAG